MKSNIEKVKMLEFVEHGDEKGNLVVVEGNIDVPFDIKRAFYIYGSDPDIIPKRDHIFRLWFGRKCMIFQMIVFCYVWQVNIMMILNMCVIMRNI